MSPFLTGMKRLFYIGVFLLAAFEVANVFFVMPMPGSQRIQSIDLAYLLYRFRWPLRVLFGAMIVAGALPEWRSPGYRRYLVPLFLTVLAMIAYVMNFILPADKLFLAPQSVVMLPAERNMVDTARLVVGVKLGAEARAYPLQFIGYHHQVRDTIEGRPVMVSFCTVCRTGRVWVPVVDGKTESFRLVGMDHFNAMFEDKSTGSWWRQATGEAIVGAQKGKTLPELPSDQVTLAQWLRLHPKSLIMQADPAFATRYANGFDYENGASRSLLTGTDTASWHEKSWVVGIDERGQNKAYDWNRLRRETVINDAVGGTPIVLVLARDRASFFAFERPDSATRFTLRGDSLVDGIFAYDLNGLRAKGPPLRRVGASQEFWHSWQAFHPGSLKY